MKIKLLIIENEISEIEVFKRIIQKDFQIDFFSSNNDNNIEKIFIKVSPDIVLLDMQVSDIELLKNISHAKKRFNEDLPFIMLASENPLELERTARELGIFFYMVRPIEVCELNEALISATRMVKKNSSKKSIGKNGNLTMIEKRYSKRNNVGGRIIDDITNNLAVISDKDLTGLKHITDEFRMFLDGHLETRSGIMKRFPESSLRKNIKGELYVGF